MHLSRRPPVGTSIAERREVAEVVRIDEGPGSGWRTELVMRIDTIGGRRVGFVMACAPEYGPHLQRRIEPLMTGVGPIEAALATGVALTELRDAGGLPDLLVSLGSAGSRRCPVGSVHQVESVAWRDVDASLLGFVRGVTPLLGHPVRVPLPTPIPELPRATLSTGADVVGGRGYDAIDADMVDMETFAVWRACERFGVGLIGLRGISDGPGELGGFHDWTALLGLIDERLAAAVDLLAAALARGDAEIGGTEGVRDELR